MRRDLSCCVAVFFSLFLSFLPATVAWSAKPSAPAEDKAAAKALVRRALECEVAGDAQRRRDLLKQALDTAPDYPPANWHSGRVEVDGQWVTLAEAVKLAAVDEQVAQYRELRDKSLGDPKRELTLARWCARARLRDESRLHFTRLLNSNGVDQNARAEAMRVLGVRNIGGRMVSDADIKHRRAVATRIQQSMSRWLPRLRAWQPLIDGTDDKKRKHAIGLMQRIDDPDIVPVLETFLFQGGPQFGKTVVDLLAKFPQHEATQTLVHYAVLSRWPNVRGTAIRQLERRPMHEYVPLLLDGLVSPITTQWQIVDAPDGTIRYRHRFLRTGPGGNYALGFDHVATPVPVVAERRLTKPLNEINEGPNRRYLYTRFQLRGFEDFQHPLEELERQLAAMTSLEEAWQREKQVAVVNTKTAVHNATVFAALEQTTGRFPKREPAAWWDWWQEYNEVQTVSVKPTCYLYRQTQSYLGDYHRVYHEPVDVYQYQTPSRYRWPRLSCFPAGTKIRTQQGRIPIERIKIGDRVLSQNPDTGELAFKLVLNTTLRPPSPMVELTVNGEDVITTLGHPVWVSEKRWRMAKLLKVGDQLHGVSGILTVEEIDEQVPVDQAHNLVVADWATYFAGEKGVLVHDNTYRAPTRALLPGLLPEEDIGPAAGNAHSR